MTIVIKVGGNELDNADFLVGLAQSVVALPDLPVIVHGGGRGTTSLMERFGVQAEFVNGLRVTDAQTLTLAIMGMVGQASMQVVNALVRVGLPALGLSGADAVLVTAQKLVLPQGDLGAVGEPIGVNGEYLHALLNAGFLPCLAPICVDRDGNLLNVNADHVAQAIAIALEVERLVFLTNVPAVTVAGQAMATLTPDDVDTFIASGDIVGGMIPKTRAAVAAVRAGVSAVLITNLEGLRVFGNGEVVGTTIGL